MTLQDKIESNKARREQAKEDGNQALLLGLLVVGGLLMMTHAAATMHRSLKDVFKTLCQKMARDDVQHVAEATGNAFSDKRDSNER